MQNRLLPGRDASSSACASTHVHTAMPSSIANTNLDNERVPLVHGGTCPLMDATPSPIPTDPGTIEPRAYISATALIQAFQEEDQADVQSQHVILVCFGPIWFQSNYT
jgi:hypothetical protein